MALCKPKLRTEQQRNDSERETMLQDVPRSERCCSWYPKTIKVDVSLECGPDGRLFLWMPRGGCLIVEREHIMSDLAPFSD